MSPRFLRARMRQTKAQRRPIRAQQRPNNLEHAAYDHFHRLMIRIRTRRADRERRGHRGDFALRFQREADAARM